MILDAVDTGKGFGQETVPAGSGKTLLGGMRRLIGIASGQTPIDRMHPDRRTGPLRHFRQPPIVVFVTMGQGDSFQVQRRKAGLFHHLQQTAPHPVAPCIDQERGLCPHHVIPRRANIPIPAVYVFRRQPENLSPGRQLDPDDPVIPVPVTPVNDLQPVKKHPCSLVISIPARVGWNDSLLKIVRMSLFARDDKQFFLQKSGDGRPVMTSFPGERPECTLHGFLRHVRQEYIIARIAAGQRVLLLDKGDYYFEPPANGRISR
jgi:hypothetical protein